MSAKRAQSASIEFSADPKSGRASHAVKAVIIAIISLILVVTAAFAVVMLTGNEEILLGSSEAYSLVSLLLE